MKNQMTQIFFSPGGTTAQIAGQVSAALAQDVQTVDLLREPPANPVQLGPDQLCLPRQGPFLQGAAIQNRGKVLCREE